MNERTQGAEQPPDRQDETERAVSSPPAVRLVQVRKNYALGSTTVCALRDIDLEIPRARFTVIQGPSGSGKSTLLNLIGCLDAPSSGSIHVAGRRIDTMSDAERTRFRAEQVGFVFQSYNLIPVLSIAENVEYPLQLCEPDRRQRRQRVEQALEAVGLAQMAGRRPADLSGGQRQRVAVARALVKRPALVLADEPTANLDQRTGAELIALMRRMQAESGTTFVFSSHDPQLIADADTRIRIVDGHIVHSGVEHGRINARREEVAA